MLSESSERTRELQNEEPVEKLAISWQWMGMAWVAFHLIAVFSEPFHFFSRSDVQTAPDAQWLRNLLKPYSQTLFLDHGYFFFAPNPGPGHLLRCVVSDDPLPAVPDDRRPTPLSQMFEKENAEEVVTTFPDRKEQWPRLLYHRYFMFSEFYYARYAPREISSEMRRDADFADRWKRDRSIYLQLQQSLAKRVQAISGKEFVRVDRLERALPDLASIHRRGLRISDLQWVTILPETLDLPEQSFRVEPERRMEPRAEALPSRHPPADPRTESPLRDGSQDAATHKLESIAPASD